MTFTFRHTKISCYLGYITQAVVNNLAPLLFVTFDRDFGISLSKLGTLVVVNFIVQIAVDMLSAQIIRIIGMRGACVLAHGMSSVGLVLMGTLPMIMDNTFIGLLIALVCCAVGGGLIEVIISPVIEAIPNDNKASQMSLLHSFYSWGQVAVVLLSTLYFTTLGISKWYMLPVIFALIPFANIFLFMKVPIAKLVEDGKEMKISSLFRTRILWLMLLFMVCSGASEMVISQWSSFLAELGLGVSKTLGDILGPCLFAFLMGLSRMLFGLKVTDRNLKPSLMICALGCVLSFALVAFSKAPMLSLIGCGLSGFFVGIMWPGIYSLSASMLPKGGTSMFMLLAFAGDIGCSSGSGLVGYVSDIVSRTGHSIFESIITYFDSTQLGLKTGIILAMIFPLILFVGMILMMRLGVFNKNRKHVSNVL